jgi:hypothetical protein
MVNSPTPGVVPTIPTKFGDLAVISDVGTCDRCRPAAERAAAHPSRRIPRALRESLLVEILEPPENLNPVSAQVTETVETAVRNMAKTETIAPAKTDETVCETKTTVKE